MLARACSNVGQLRLVLAIGRPPLENEPPVAIAAIDIAVLVDLEPHARMAERGRTEAFAAANSAGAVAIDPVRFDKARLGRGKAHAAADNCRCPARQLYWMVTSKVPV